MSSVKPVSSLVWTRKSVAINLLIAVDEHQRKMGVRLAALRDARGLTQEELAHAAGVSTKTVSRLENGRHEAEMGTLRKLAQALDVPELEIRGTAPTPLGLGAETQLDRIEAKLNRILNALNAATEEEERAVAAALAPLAKEVESQLQPAPDLYENRQVASRRTRA